MPGGSLPPVVTEEQYDEAYHQIRAVINLLARSDFRGHEPDTDPVVLIVEVSAMEHGR